MRSLANQKRCDGIDPDNVDGYVDSTKGAFGFSSADSAAFVTKLADEAHTYGLAIGIKNAPGILNNLERPVNEECSTHDACESFGSFLSSGKPVYHIEYAIYIIRDGTQVDIRVQDSQRLRDLTSDQLEAYHCLGNGQIIQACLNISALSSRLLT